MYTRYFGFQDKPFTLVPNPTFFYLSSKHSLALTYLEYGIQENIGFVLLTGEVGSGKTTLIRYLLLTILANLEVAVISNTNVSSHELIKLILQELEIEPVSEHKSQNLDRLNDYLIRQYSMGKRVVLIIDEAQNLCREAMEEVRMLSNLSTDNNLLFQIILVGQPELRRAIQQDAFKQLAQRIAINYHLRGLDKEEVGLYIQYRIQQVKGEDLELFDAGAVDLIYEHSKGIPRMINVLCDACLVYAYADEKTKISAEIVEQVLQDREAEWGSAEPTSAVAQETTNGSSLVENADNNFWISLGQINHELGQLKLRVEGLEKDQIDQNKTAKDELVAWLESRLKKAVTEIKKLQQLNEKKQEEIERLHERENQVLENLRRSERKPQEEQELFPEIEQEEDSDEYDTGKVPSPRLKLGILYPVAGICLVALVLHLYFRYMA